MGVIPNRACALLEQINDDFDDDNDDNEVHKVRLIKAKLKAFRPTQLVTHICHNYMLLSV